GVSLAPFDSLNLANHVGNATEQVAENRARLRQALDLPAEPVWLKQVHGSRIVDAVGPNSFGQYAEADGAYTRETGVVCAVLTADCLPLLLCDQSGTHIAAVHVGWRGLAAGVIEAALHHFDDTRHVLAWLGPAIGPQSFEVGDEVRELFIAHDAEAQHAFRPSPAQRWLADIYQLARQRLHAQGVTRIYGGECCTYSDPERFYSYRRDGVTGRMATLIWLKNG
ncbi:MAG: peptidoglycan editing factor PgeF, partial [Gammaproteobacteria bacterium]